MQEFYRITLARNTPYKEMRKRVLEWGGKYGVKKEVEEFYNENNKRGEERKKKVIAILDNAPKAYREYLALFDDTKTLEQIDEDEKKMHAEKPEEYNVVMYTNALARDYYYGIYRRNKPAVYYNPI
ncbi:hypothetical protein ANCCAN_13226 [Ancylostoma caninum]|uniref:SXP/RAL-2 family protein Ani s 5-like cation-binding domain-containing protein n=1 Tax=Ancylostoma caninum TaxID=29170 RepID=A0A368GDH8_ANCCA|nr:hypothetical protein ANCCAN_13226 [Ancylostoma caninum]